MPSLTPFLWYDDDLEQAIELYGSIFGDPKLEVLRRTPEGGLFLARFEIFGQRIEAMNAGPGHPHSDAFSFSVRCQGQEEVDRYWDALTAGGGAESQCGWLVDPFGISWQIVPVELEAALGDPDPAKAQYAMQAMLKMKKIVIADLTYGS
jgi:predicted 3-demethylubiquinone-9 3-methyltransferase (glyoxalase superfamily)